MEGGRQVKQSRKTSHSHTLFDLLAIDSSYSQLILLLTSKLQNCSQMQVFVKQLLLNGDGTGPSQGADRALKDGPYRNC